MAYNFDEMKFQLDTVILFDQKNLLNEFFQEADFLKEYIATYKRLDKRIKGAKQCCITNISGKQCLNNAYFEDTVCSRHKKYAVKNVCKVTKKK
jgi:uncharacterized membrane-anchored protein YhcB (DUF1043 family)